MQVLSKNSVIYSVFLKKIKANTFQMNMLLLKNVDIVKYVVGIEISHTTDRYRTLRRNIRFQFSLITLSSVNEE